MGKYDAQAATALRILTAKGGPIVVTRATSSGFNAVTQAETISEAAHTFIGVGLPPGRSAEFRVGSLVGKRAVEFYLAQRGQSIQPQPGDKVRWNGVDWTIFWSTTYDPAADGAILTIAYAER